MKTSLLKNIRVVDYSRILVGAYCSMMLSDLGAEVIKVEPLEGDETRKWGPPFKNNRDSTYFLSINRNKKSICMDVRKKEAIEITKELVKKSDIFIENNIPGKIRHYGLDYETLKEINNKLIYVSVSSYGEKGPLKNAPGFDLSIQAFSGLMNITGFKDGPPVKVGYPLCDIMTGSHLNSAILAALLNRERNGVGEYINTSLMEVNLFAMTNIVSSWLNGKLNSSRKGNDHPNISPYGVFILRSGEFIALAVATENQFNKLVDLFGLNKEEIKSKFPNNKVRVEKRDELKNIIQNCISELDDNELISKLEKYEIPFSKINSMKDIFESKQIEELNFVESLETEYYGKLQYPRHPIRYSNIQTEQMKSPPLLGEHSIEVLKNILNYDDNKINHLLDSKIIYK
jgi:succinate--hydroxymethylglutarate CoA-transferase